MIAAREGAFAELALERPVAGMLAVVSGQLVGSSELPPAVLPTALIWFLASMGAKMSLEMGALAVGLRASVVGTPVRRRGERAWSPSATQNTTPGSFRAESCCCCLTRCHQLW